MAIFGRWNWWLPELGGADRPRRALAARAAAAADARAGPHPARAGVAVASQSRLASCTCLGRELDPALRPVIGVAIGSSVARATAFTFLGVWAIKQLHASQVELSFGFLGGAIAALRGGVRGRPPLGSRRPSARDPRRPGPARRSCRSASSRPATTSCRARADRRSSPSSAPARAAAEDAMVADLVPPEGREAGYAAVRVARTSASRSGRCSAACCCSATLVAALRRHVRDRGGRLGRGVPLPARAAGGTARSAAASAARSRSSGATRRSCSSWARRSLASMTYVAFDSLLADLARRLARLSPVDLGLRRRGQPDPGDARPAAADARGGRRLALGEARDRDAADGCAVHAARGERRVAVSSCCSSLVFVVGEMLWVPTSQAVAAAFAPDDIRGAYMGVFGGSSQTAWAVTPFLGLQVRSAFGDAAMWAGARRSVALAGHRRRSRRPRARGPRRCSIGAA